jgi:hypothetical protein
LNDRIDKSSELFRRLFPNLTDELNESKSSTHMDRFRLIDHENGGNSREWAGYSPGVVDFIRRCDTEGEAEEIINYMEEKGEITAEEADKLRKRLRRGGLSSFGGRKKADFYHHVR